VKPGYGDVFNFDVSVFQYPLTDRAG